MNGSSGSARSSALALLALGVLILFIDGYDLASSSLKADRGREGH